MKTNKIKIALILAVSMLMIAFPAPASASVPPEWKGAVTNDVTLYMVSMQHIEESWAKENIARLVQGYTNRGYVNERSLKELKAKMEWFIQRDHIKEPSNIPYCNDCFTGDIK